MKRVRKLCLKIQFCMDIENTLENYSTFFTKGAAIALQYLRCRWLAVCLYSGTLAALILQRSNRVNKSG